MLLRIINSKFFVPASILLIILLCILTRLPQLLSPHFLLDEDECVLGLMAKHTIEAKGIPVFFYGQTYGFSAIETLLISAAYFLFGYSDYSVKLPMFLLFITGILFFYKTLIICTDKKWVPLIITILLICSPAWAVWSMKARGGYLTAFCLSNTCTWLLFKKAGNIIFRWVLLGFLSALIFYSQPLWLPGLAPLLCYQLFNGKAHTKSFNFLVGTMPVVILLETVKRSIYHMWSPKVFGIQPHISNAVHLLYDHLHGYYYLDFIYIAPLVCKVFAVLFAALILGLLGMAIWYSFKNWKPHQLFITSALSVLLILSYSIFLTDHAPRYLLPLTGCTLLTLFFLLNRLHIRYALSVAIPLIIIGSFSLLTFRDYEFLPYSKKQLLGCVNYLQQHQLNYIFCNDVPQEWQILFYSREEVICRESNNIDRYPLYIQQVDSAYTVSPVHTAVVDFSGDLKDMEPNKTILVSGIFFVLEQPGRQLLADMEMKF